MEWQNTQRKRLAEARCTANRGGKRKSWTIRTPKKDQDGKDVQQVRVVKYRDENLLMSTQRVSRRNYF